MTTKDKVLLMMHKAAAAKRLNDKVMAKRAEYRSVPSDAYIAGFCKAAEAHGVDPVELMKAAGLWGDIKGGLKQFGQNVWNGAKALGKGQINGMAELGKGMWNGAKQIGQGNFAQGFKTMGQGAVDGAKAYVNGAQDAWNSAKQMGQDAWNGAKSLGKSVVNGVVNDARDTWNGAKALGRGIANGAQNAWDGGSFIHGFASSMMPSGSLISKGAIRGAPQAAAAMMRNRGAPPVGQGGAAPQVAAATPGAQGGMAPQQPQMPQ